MQNQDGSRDPPGGRNMSQPTAVHHRRGSGSTSVSSLAASGSSVNPKEDHQTPPQPGSSSPGPQQHSSSTAPQSQSVMKKKSGFQITSVTPAQMSTNNSIADDTESYDDMDESHTEDLSSSDMLDVSVSRATDTGLPERSSSDETLNSLQSVETPGLVSPNEPLHPHSLPAVSLHQQLVNGEAQLPQLPPCVQSVEAVVPVPGQARGPPSPAPPPPASLADTPHNTSLAQANATAGSNTLLSSGPLGLDSTVQGLSTGVGPGGPAGVPITQTQSNPGSRFRVVKLDSNSEPYRKGRWMCTEYYEKEVPPADARPGEALPPEREPAGVAASAPQTLQPYQQHTQDFTSPQATQNLPALVQSPPLTHTGPHDPGTNLVQPGQPSLASSLSSAPQVVTLAPSGVVQHLAYAVDAQPACVGYPVQLSTGLLAMVGGRQPDFIQPTAPFQAQAQAPLAPAPTGASLVGLSGASQPHRGHAPSTQPAFAPAQPSSSSRAPAHSATYLPLTSLQADLQPLLTHGLALSQAHSGAAHLGSMPSLTASQLQDAQRLLFQHQGLAGLPRLGVTGGGEAGAEARAAGVLGRGEAGSDARAAGGQAYMGDTVSALRNQPADEEEDSSSSASVVAIDNKIEQAMDLVKSHLMYAVREEVEVLKEQIKELVERNSQLEQENSLLKALASPEQMAQFQAQVDPESPTDSTQAIAPSQPSSTSA